MPNFDLNFRTFAMICHERSFYKKVGKLCLLLPQIFRITRILRCIHFSKLNFHIFPTPFWRFFFFNFTSGFWDFAFEVTIFDNIVTSRAKSPWTQFWPFVMKRPKLSSGRIRIIKNTVTFKNSPLHPKQPNRPPLLTISTTVNWNVH